MRNTTGLGKFEPVGSWVERWQKIRPSIEEEPLSSKVEQVTELKVEGVKLKPFPDDVACLPNEWVRSGLFAATNKMIYVPNPDTELMERVYFRNKKVTSFSENVKLFYTGYDLNQFDLRVWLTSIKESKTCYLGSVTSMTRYEFCEAARIARGGKSTDLVENSLERLSYAHLKSETYKKDALIRVYHDNLLGSFSINKETDRLEITLSPKLANMFASQTTWIDWDMFHSLKGEFVRALALQIWSHEADPDFPQKLSLSKIKELTRSKTDIRNLRRMVRGCLPLFQQIGIVGYWKFEDDILTFTRPKN